MTTNPIPPVPQTTITDPKSASGQLGEPFRRWFNQIRDLLGAAVINAPSNATYITQTANALLPNAQPLSTLSSGIVKVVGGTGTLTSESTIQNSELTNSGVTQAVYGDAQHVGQITVNSKGIITAANNTLITGTLPGGTASGDLTGSYPSPTVVQTQTTDDNSTNATMYPVWKTSNTGSLPETVSSTKLTWNPSTGVLSTPIVALAANPTTNLQAATKQYVDNAISAVNPAVECTAASTANIPGTYVVVGGGIGDTFTITATGAFTLDGQTPAATSRVLLKDQSTTLQNGIYIVTIAGSLGVSPVLTRALDYDTASDVNSTGVIPVLNGTINALTGWVISSAVTTVGTDPITYTQFTKNPTAYLQVANNLSDLNNAATARTNIGMTDANLSFTDITTNNVSTTKHGFAPKAPNDATKFLDGTGAFSVPTGSGGELILISRQTASASTSIDFTSIASASYDHYIMSIDNVLSATGGGALGLRISIAGVFQTGSTYTDLALRWTSSGVTESGSTTDTLMLLTSTSAVGTTAGTSEVSGFVHIPNCAQTTAPKRISSQMSVDISGPTPSGVLMSGWFASNSAVDGFRIFNNAGNLTSGTIALYGVKNT